MVNMKYCKVQISNELSWFNHEFIIISQLVTMPKNLILEASMYQRNGRLGISNQIVRHLLFYVIMSLFSILSAYSFCQLSYVI